jgi:large subunit ribosomal protein L21
MQAVAKIKGHQYLVKKGDKLKVQKLKAEPDEKISFEEVYLVFSVNNGSAPGGDEKNFKLGKPKIGEAKVEAKVLRHLRGKKVIVFKYGPKTRRRVKRGFRPEYTEIEIVSIS